MIGSSNSGASSTEIKQFLFSLIGNAPIGIIALDMAGNCTLANGCAGRVFGTTPERLVDVHLDALLAAWPELGERLPAQGSGRVGFDLDTVARHDDLYDVRGRTLVDGLLLTFHDVTEAVRIRESQACLVGRLERANRELAEFAYICAHDMKSPVANLKGLGAHIDESEGLDGEAAELFAMMMRTVAGLDAKLASLNDILAFRRTLDGERTGSCVLAEAMDDVAESLHHDLERAAAEITLEGDRDAVLPIADPHLQSILHNLVSNAVKYRHAERHPRITIRTRRTAKAVQLEVSDNGMGMNLEHARDRLFGLFNRVHTHVEGSGIGLYLVKSIAESYGGHVGVESVETHGTTFTVEIPHAA